MFSLLPLLALVVSPAGQVAGTPYQPADLEYRPTVLVRRFESPGLPEARGELASEAVAAALEAGGLLRAARPAYKDNTEWVAPGPGDVKLDDLKKDAQGRWTTDKVDAYGVGGARTARVEAALPDADYAVEGTVSRVGEVWWVKGTLRDLANRRPPVTASARGEGDKALFESCEALARELEKPVLRRVLAHRAEASIRMMERGLVPPVVAAQRLEALAGAYPDALEPAVGRLWIAAKTAPPDPEAVTAWSTKVIERLRAAEPEQQRFFVRLGIDPYLLLAAQCRAQGLLDDASAVLREAVSYYPGPRLSHWRELARVETVRGRPHDAAAAWAHYVERAPLDADALLDYAAALVRIGKGDEAAARLRAFLTNAPDAPRAADVRTRLAEIEKR